MTPAGASTGRWLVQTVTALRLLDLDAGTARRATLQAPAGYETSELRGDGAEPPLLDVLDCRIGAPMLLLVSPWPGVVTWRSTTAVQCILRLPEPPPGPTGRGAPRSRTRRQ